MIKLTQSPSIATFGGHISNQSNEKINYEVIYKTKPRLITTGEIVSLTGTDSNSGEMIRVTCDVGGSSNGGWDAKVYKKTIGERLTDPTPIQTAIVLDLRTRISSILKICQV